MNSCIECAYYEGPGDPRYAGHTRPCKRYPPVPVAVPGTDACRIQYVQAMVRGSTTACGEFERRGEGGGGL